ncbi:MAG: NAD(P)H-hydrate dehydratase [Verrucomicrobiia bacterium]|jgi:NAD(P)H-hydrate epimerase
MAIPILTVEQVREWESASWAAGISQEEVIRNAGKSVAVYAEKMTRPADKIMIIAGKGHNGDDAIQAGEQIAQRNVRVLRITDPATDIANLKSALNEEYSLIIDGLFGIGLNRELDDKYRAVIELINQAKVPVLSVDVPSGLNAQTGEVMGAAITASATVTLGAVKIGMIKPTAAQYTGRLYVAPQIGLKKIDFKTDLYWTEAADFAAFPPKRNLATHKGTYGHLLILAGSPGYHGAAVLAAKSAQRAQPGLITLVSAQGSYIPVASQLAQVMVHPWKPSMEFPEKITAILIGCGLASSELPPELIDHSIKLWNESPVPICVDASALDWLPKGRINSQAPRIVTPHPGEAARMLKTTTEEVLSDRIESVRKISKLYGNCYVVLKGHQTIIGKSDGILYFNSTGNPYLAQGGAGDVLAGFIGGLIAQPTLQKDILTTLRYAVWRHGLAADYLQKNNPGNWAIEDLIPILNLPLTEKEIVL